MLTICSAIRKAMRVGDNTVSTSTNCSADCGTRKRRTRWTRRARDLEYINNLLGNREVQDPQGVCHVVHHLRHRKIENLHQRCKLTEILHGRAASPCLASQEPQTEVLAGPPGGEALPELGRVVQLEPLPRSWPCSVPLGRRGAESRPGAWRRLAVRAEGTGVTVALAASWRLPQRAQHWACPPSEVRTEVLASST